MPEEGDMEMTAALDQGGSVEVTLLSADGLPVAGGRIEHRAPGSNGNRFGGFGGAGKSAATDSSGKVLIANLAPGLHRFRPAKASGGGGMGAMIFEAEGQDQSAKDWSEVEVIGGTIATLVVSEPELAKLSGRITEAGLALAGATLSLSKSGGSGAFAGMDDMPFSSSPRAKTDGEGRFSFDAVELGRYELVVRHATRAMPSRYPVEVDSSSLEFDVDLPLSILEGRVLDIAGKPVQGARVSAERKRAEGERREYRMITRSASSDGGEGMIFDSSSGMGQSSARTDEDGRYTLRGVESDVDLVVRVDAKDCEPTASDAVSVAMGQTRSGVDVRVSPAGQLKVKIMAPDGGKPGMCLVRAEYIGDVSDGKQVAPKTEFAQSGSVSFKGLRPGRWKLQAESLESMGGDSAGGLPESRVVLVVAHETASVELPGP
jgi:hypothetical protein